MNEEKIIYTINVGDFKAGKTTYENRCLSASFGGQGVASESIPWAEQGNPWDWKYEDGEFTYDPIEMPVQTPVPTELEKLQAQIDYISMMTGVDL